jgi:hypothetical protein
MTELPAPPTPSAIMGPTTDALGLPVTTPESHTHAHARLDEINRTPALRELMLRGDPSLKAEVEQLGRTLRTSTSVTIGGQQNPAEEQQHYDGVTAFVGVPLADAFGPTLGPQIEAEVRSNAPITAAEHRAAKVKLAEFKGREFQDKMKAGDPLSRARYFLVHNMLTRPIKMDAT